MKYILILALLVSCNGKDSAPGECLNTKPLFSAWTLEGATFDLTGASYDTFLEINYGSPTCDPNEGDLLIRISENGRVLFRNCANTFNYDNADYEIRCNALHLKYDSDGTEEVFR